MKAILERYTCRDFKPDALSRSQLDTLVAAGLAAPSAMNLQPWRLVVVSDKGFIDSMDAAAMSPENAGEPWYARMTERGGKMFYGAPAMIFVGVDDSKYAMHDCGIVVQNIALAAHEMGLGSCICGMARIPLEGTHGAQFLEKIAFPQGYSFGMSILLGYANSGKAPHEHDYTKVVYM
jgi:nitroreductase